MTLSVKLLTSSGLATVTERVTTITATDELVNTLTFETPYVPLALQLLSEARIYLDSTDRITEGGVIRNRNAPTPTANLVPFPTGAIVNEVPNGNLTLTNFAADIDDAGGAANATLLETALTNRNFYIIRPSQFTPSIPNGTLSVRFKMRSKAGRGVQNFTTLFPGSTTTRTVDETATVFEEEIAYTGASDFIVRLVDSGAEIYIDQLQVYEGAIADMPDWSEEVFGGGRKAIAHATSMPSDAAGGFDMTGQTSGLWAIDPSFPQPHDYSEFTYMLVSSADALPTGGSMLVNYHDDDGAASTGDALIIESTSPYVGEYNGYATTGGGTAGSSSRSQHAANLAGDGVVISGQSRDATHRTVYTDTAAAFTEERAFGGINTSRWAIHSWNGTSVADYRANMVEGTFYYFLAWDRKLTRQEWSEVASHLRSKLAEAGATLAPISDYHVISGDSNSTRANGDWTQLITADGYMTGNNLIASITSVGGDGLADLERDYGGSEGAGAGLGLTNATITQNGRFNATDKPALLSAVTAPGRRVLYNIPIGTNDWDILEAYTGTIEEQADAYSARLQTFIEYVLANTPERVDVMWYTLKPQAPATRPDFEDHRQFVNAAMIAWAATKSRVFICDTGGSATLGDPANFATYYNPDEIHFITDGDIEKASIAKAAIEAWRVARGVG